MNKRLSKTNKKRFTPQEEIFGYIYERLNIHIYIISYLTKQRKIVLGFTVLTLSVALVEFLSSKLRYSHEWS